MDEFAAFILTHGRPDNVMTYDLLRRRGYTGKIVLVVDDMDKTYNKYIENFGDEVFLFDKKKAGENFDKGNNFNEYRSIIYARNASFEIARQLGYKYFIQLDDDYSDLLFRFNHNLEYGPKSIKNLDKVFQILLEYFIKSGADSLALAQGGDFIGGAENRIALKPRLLRKCMNSFICSTERPFKFIGLMNEDVNTYTRNGSTGSLMLTTNQVSLKQKETQSREGGITGLYLKFGTYVKSFHTVLYHPSSVTIGMMGDKHYRLHHKINWKNTVPKIIDPKYKK